MSIHGSYGRACELHAGDARGGAAGAAHGAGSRPGRSPGSSTWSLQVVRRDGCSGSSRSFLFGGRAEPAAVRDQPCRSPCCWWLPDRGRDPLARPQPGQGPVRSAGRRRRRRSRGARGRPSCGVSWRWSTCTSRSAALAIGTATFSHALAARRATWPRAPSSSASTESGFSTVPIAFHPPARPRGLRRVARRRAAARRGLLARSGSSCCAPVSWTRSGARRWRWSWRRRSSERIAPHAARADRPGDVADLRGVRLPAATGRTARRCRGRAGAARPGGAVRPAR